MATSSIIAPACRSRSIGFMSGISFRATGRRIAGSIQPFSGGAMKQQVLQNLIQTAIQKRYRKARGRDEPPRRQGRQGGEEGRAASGERRGIGNQAKGRR